MRLQGIGILGKRDITYILLLLFLVFLFFLPLLYPQIQIPAQPDYGQSDLWHAHYPAKHFLSETLKQGKLPLWNPYVGNGFPEFAKNEAGSLYLLNLVFFTFLSFPAALIAVFISSIAVAALGMYVFMRLIGLRSLSALYSAAIFAFSTYFMTSFVHISRLQSASLIPLILAALVWLLRKQHVLSAIILSLLLAQQVYAGHFQTVLITWIVLGIYVLYDFYVKGVSMRKCMYLLSATGVYLLLIAVQMLPTMELINATSRGDGFSPQTALYFSFPWKNVVTLFDPFSLGSPHNGTYPSFTESNGSIFWENATYISLIGIVLAGLGAYVTRSKKIWIFLIGTTIVGALLMTGKYSPLYFAHTIPPFSFFRTPSKYVLIFLVAICMFAGFGFQYIQSKVEKKKVLGYILLFVIVGISIYQLYSFHMTYYVSREPQKLLDEPASVQEIKKSYTPAYRVYSTSMSTTWNSILYSTGWQSMEEYEYLQGMLTPNVNTFYGVRTFGVYQILMTQRHRIMNNVLQLVLSGYSHNQIELDRLNKILDTYAIKYFITLDDIDLGVDSITFDAPQAYTDREIPLIALHVRNEAVPRYRLVQTYDVAETVQEVTVIMQSEEYDPASSVILEKEVEMEVIGSELGESTEDDDLRVELIEESYDVLSFRSNAEVPSLLVLADSYYPGWIARIDGTETEILAANVGQRAVVVPSGKHTIEFRYEPMSFARGLRLTQFGYVLIVLAAGFHFVSARTRAS